MDDAQLKTILRFETEKKSLSAAYVLAAFYGLFGAHDYYLGSVGRGVVKLILTISVIGLVFSLIWVLIDLFSLPGRVQEMNRQLAVSLVS